MLDEHVFTALRLSESVRPPGLLHRRWRRQGPRSVDALARRTRAPAAHAAPPVVRSCPAASPHEGGPCKS